MRVEPELLEERPERERHARRLDEPGRRPRVEVEDDLRRLARRLDAPEERVELDRCLVREPEQRGDAVHHAEAERPALAPARLEDREPVRLALALVLVPADSVDAVREAPQR